MMKMFVKEYNKVSGEPFRVENYKGHKLEMYYFNDHPNYLKYVQSGRFSIWTSNGIDYRLLIDKGYYEKVNDLYDNEINNIWLDYTNVVYSEQRKMSRKYMYISLAALVVVMGLSLTVQQLFPSFGQNMFLISMVLLFIILFGSSHFQQKGLRKVVESENQKTTLKIKETMGEEKFNNVLKGQEEYYQEFFNSPDDENLENEEELKLEDKGDDKDEE